MTLTPSQRLSSLIAQARVRRAAEALLAALVWSAMFAASAFGLTAWLDVWLELSPDVRIFAAVAMLAFSLALTVYWPLRVLLTTRAAELAREIDAAARAGGVLLTGFELAGGPRAGDAALTAGLAALAVQRGAAAAGKFRLRELPRVFPKRPAALALMLLCGLFAVVAESNPGMFGRQLARLFDPLGDHPPYDP